MRVRIGSAVMLSFVVITGRTMNFTPKSIVITTEKPPIVVDGTNFDTKLPTTVNISTVAIITRPFFTSRFLFFP